ncbi:MAG: hypothetical protein LBK40_02155 [Spirochaetaceae bacterium]|nr:hypothetical protein [Spirochaetaceae bacterium]
MKKIIMLCMVFFLFFAACEITEERSPKSRTIKYEVTGAGLTVDITMRNSGLSTKYLYDEILPESGSWSESFTVKGYRDDLFEAYISAKNKNHPSGTVTVSISVDGTRVETTSSAADGIATASYDIYFPMF